MNNELKNICSRIYGELQKLDALPSWTSVYKEWGMQISKSTPENYFFRSVSGTHYSKSLKGLRIHIRNKVQNCLDVREYVQRNNHFSKIRKMSLDEFADFMLKIHACPYAGEDRCPGHFGEGEKKFQFTEADYKCCKKCWVDYLSGNNSEGISNFDAISKLPLEKFAELMKKNLSCPPPPEAPCAFGPEDDHCVSCWIDYLHRI